MPRLCEVYPGICLTTEEKARKNLSKGSRRIGKLKRNLSRPWLKWEDTSETEAKLIWLYVVDWFHVASKMDSDRLLSSAWIFIEENLTTWTSTTFLKGTCLYWTAYSRKPYSKNFSYFVDRASRYNSFLMTNLSTFLYIYLFHLSTCSEHQRSHYQEIELY